MAMNLGPSSGGDEPELMMEINTTPLIDVMLVLLIMLIITIPIQLHAVNLDMPTGTPPPQLVQPEVVKIDIDADSQLFWNGEPVATLAELHMKLRDMSALPAGLQPELHLRPHKQSRYAVAAAVMADVQRLGLGKFGIVGSEQFIE